MVQFVAATQRNSHSQKSNRLTLYASFARDTDCKWRIFGRIFIFGSLGNQNPSLGSAMKSFSFKCTVPSTPGEIFRPGSNVPFVSRPSCSQTVIDPSKHHLLRKLRAVRAVADHSCWHTVPIFEPETTDAAF
jgi:hypothetical protein